LNEEPQVTTLRREENTEIGKRRLNLSEAQAGTESNDQMQGETLHLVRSRAHTFTVAHWILCMFVPTERIEETVKKKGQGQKINALILIRFTFFFPFSFFSE
jgi:hypothetical protein